MPTSVIRSEGIIAYRTGRKVPDGSDSRIQEAAEADNLQIPSLEFLVSITLQLGGRARIKIESFPRLPAQGKGPDITPMRPQERLGIKRQRLAGLGKRFNKFQRLPTVGVIQRSSGKRKNEWVVDWDIAAISVTTRLVGVIVARPVNDRFAHPVPYRGGAVSHRAQVIRIVSQGTHEVTKLILNLKSIRQGRVRMANGYVTVSQDPVGGMTHCLPASGLHISRRSDILAKKVAGRFRVVSRPRVIHGH